MGNERNIELARENLELRNQRQEPMEQAAASAIVSCSESSEIRNASSTSGSRQGTGRQKLTNLNKAIENKWLPQLEQGEMSDSQIEELIRTSPAAQHFRESAFSKGEEYREEEFVRKALMRAK